MADQDREAIIQECARVVIDMAKEYEERSLQPEDLSDRFARLLRLAASRIRRLAE